MNNEADRKNAGNHPEQGNELEIPSLYQVVLHNDNFTPIEFVVGLMEKFFYMDRRKAAEKTLELHARGKAVCGVYSRDFAESKVTQVMEFAELHDHPLDCSMEAA